jgi:DNA-binding NtrC family response regulator
MTLGKSLLLFSDKDPVASALAKATSAWGCMVSTCASTEELRARVEGGQFDMVLVEPSVALRRIVTDGELDEVLKLSLAEIEKRHIQRVLASTGGNKTRAARILSIDTKTLYNKLKSYQASDAAARKRRLGPGSMSIV